MIKKLTYLFLFLITTSQLYAQPLNDECVNATPITIPANGIVCITGNNIGATATNWTAANCGQTSWTSDVWYTFVANGSINQVTVRPTGSPAAQRLGVAVYTGTCGSLFQLGTHCAVAPASGDSASVTQVSTAGTQYFVEVSSFIAAGGFELCINSNTPPAAPGSTCANATNLCDLSPFNLAVGPVGTGTFSPSCFLFGSVSSVWYKFTVGVGGVLAWNCAPTLPNTELDWALFDVTNGCSNFNANTIRCNYHLANSLSAPIGMSPSSITVCPISSASATVSQEICPSFNVVAGRTYAIFIDNFSSNSSGWNFNWNGSTFQMASSQFTVDPDSSCSSITSNFTNLSNGASSYVWNFGDGSPTSTLQNPPSKTYTTTGTYLVSLTTTAANGCTDVSSRSIQIFPTPTLTTVSDTICAGGSATVSATPSITGGTYLWTPGNATTQSITVSPASSVTYTVVYTLAGCQATSTARVTVQNPTWLVSAGNDTTVCANQTIQLNGSITPTGTYTYLWSPTTGLSNPNILNPITSPASGLSYTLSVTDVDGCSKTDVMVVTVNGISVQVNAQVTPSIICPGQQVQLTSNAIPETCGPAVTCAANTISGVIGVGTASQPGNGTQQPSLLGNFVRSGRNQMLYTAAELTASLGGASVIKAVAFNITIFNSNAYLQDFTVKMTCTNATSLSTFNNALTTVYTATTYSPVATWNNFFLQQPFAWDGVSNIIIDICWNNPSLFGNQNNKAECTTTSFNSYLYSSGATNQCGVSSGQTVSTFRPNLRFFYCIPDITNYAITWTPSTGANGVANSAIANTTANPVVSTNYTINVANGGCVGSDIVSVLVDTSRLSAGPNISSCPSASVPLTATVTGVVLPGPATFAWTTLAGANAGTGATVNVTPATNTTYIVTMNGGACVKRDTINVVITGLTVTPATTNITCFGANNGKIKVTANGNAPYSYVWSANANTLNRDSAVSLPPATYSVTVTDATGCTGSASATVTQPADITFTQVLTNIYCNGGNNGAIALNVLGGTTPYNFAWSNSLPNNDTVSGLTQGAYTVIITDANSCVENGNFTITQPTAIVFGSVQIKNIRCINGNDGRIQVSASGGTGAITYNWSHSTTLNTATATTLTAGSYTVTAVDASSCSVLATYQVTQPITGLTLAAPTITNTDCFGSADGSITANPNGGILPFTYSWNTTPIQVTQTATGLIAGSYTVVVSDDSLCTASGTYTVNQPAQITIAGVVTNANCNGTNSGAINVTVTNGLPTFIYTWSANANGAVTEDISTLFDGIYTLTVTDANLCSATASFTVTEPTALTLNAPTTTNVLCFGQNTGSITANPTGGTPTYTYLWTNGATLQTNTGLAAGSYDVNVRDANGCSVTGNYAITEPATALAFGNPTVVNVLCNGAATGSITVSNTGGTGAYVYSWSQNANLNNVTATGLIAGTYTVTVRDGNNCSLTSSNIVTQPTAITFGNAIITNVSCFGGNTGSAQVAPNGGTGNYNYTWNGVAGTNPETGLLAGTYTVEVTDASNCTASTTLNITEPSALLANPIVQDALCAGAFNGIIDANPSGGSAPYLFKWNDAQGQSTQVASALYAGNYVVTITDNTNCSISATATVGEPGSLTMTITTTQVKCPGDLNGTLSVSATGGTAPYTYSATVDGANFAYPTNGTIVGLASGYYLVILSDTNGCTITDTGFVPSPVADVITYTVDSTSCFGTNYTDGAIFVVGQTIQNMPYQYAVDGGVFGYSGDLYNLAAGNHVVAVQNIWGCTTLVDILVPEPENGRAEILPQDSTIQVGESIRLVSLFTPFASSTITSYNWTPTLGLSCTDCANPVATPYDKQTDYLLTITYNGLCQATASVTVLVENKLPVFIPNSFSPNGDGNNDVFAIYGEGIKFVDLKIFNRWGEKVYESNTQFAGWDGTYKSVLQNPGVYVYQVKLTFLDNKTMERNGSITLLK